MPEARDRLSRPVDVTALFTRLRSGDLGILVDEPERTSVLFGSPLQRGTPGTTVTHGQVSMPGSRGGRRLARGSSGTPRTGNGRGRLVYGSPSVGRENTPARTGRRGRGHPTRSRLPSWYPRTPLRDITAVVRAFERRRAPLGEIEGQQIETPIRQEQGILDSSAPIQSAHLEHYISMVSPSPTVGIKRCPPSVAKVQKILLSAASQKTAGESEFLTPQKKLLNSIDTVEKVVMEELERIKRTPSAKKVEREQRVRTLMSMR